MALTTTSPEHPGKTTDHTIHPVMQAGPGDRSGKGLPEDREETLLPDQPPVRVPEIMDPRSPDTGHLSEAGRKGKGKKHNLSLQGIPGKQHRNCHPATGAG